MTGKRKPTMRLVLAALLAVPTIVLSVSASVAAPSKQEVEAARAKLDGLNRRLDQLVEQYDQEQIRLEQAQAKLEQAGRARQVADAAEARARTALERRAVVAFTGMGSQLGVLLGAQSLTDFSDRLQFMGALAQNDADLATRAATARQEAAWAADRLTQAAEERRTTVEDLAAREREIRSGIAAQQTLYETLDGRYRDALAAEAAAAAPVAPAEPPGGSPSPGSGDGSDGGGFVPPPNASAVEIAIAAARSVIGTPYVWGAADPSVGFDCSGLVMWAYAQAGISLPHSSAMMYDLLPKVPREELVAGDLIFSYTPVSHVSLYIGGGMEIDASHPGPGGQVQVRPVYWQYFVAGGRIS